jgi:HAMP domain-containing protein
VLLLLFITFITFCVTYLISYTYLRERLLEERQLTLDHELESLDIRLSRYRDLVFTIKNIPEIQSLTTGTEDINYSENWRASLADIFASFALVDNHLYQLRYLDASGQEIVRVNSQNGIVQIVPKSGLQNKSSRYYIQDLLTLPMEGFYVSPIDLNVEQGEIEFPYKPVVRLGTPIYSQNGTVLEGIIILNIDAKVLFEGLYLSQDSDYLIISSPSNEIIFYPDDSKTFGLQKGTGVTLDTLYPNLSSLLSNSFKMGSHDIFLSDRFILSNDFEDSYLNVFYVIEREALFSYFRKFFVISALSISVIFIASLFLVFKGIYAFTSPIEKIIDAAKQISKGNYSYRVSFKSNPEFNLLASYFNEMAQKIELVYEKQENLVKQNSIRLQKLNDAFTGRELRMKELKAELKNLKERLSKYEKEI